jgi:hypothetical protein
MLRRSYTTHQKVESLEGAITFEATDAGRLLMDSPFWQKELVPVGPMLWREAAGDELVAFRDDGHAFLGSIPVIALERIPWHESPGCTRRSSSRPGSCSCSLSPARPGERSAAGSDVRCPRTSSRGAASCSERCSRTSLSPWLSPGSPRTR